MKNIAALTLLSVALAACGQATTPTAHTAPDIASTYASSLNTSGMTLQDLQAKLDAQGEASINALSAQVLAPQVYLNVLKIAGSDNVRAYLKSTFASPVTCALNWGDSSASTPFASPTTLRVDTRDHSYAVFGTYAVTATCVNGNTVVGSTTFTVQAGRKGSTFDFESPVAPPNSYTIVSSVASQGFTLNNDSSFIPIWSSDQSSNSSFGSGSDGTQSYDPVYPTTVTSDDGSSFSLKSFDYLNMDRGHTAYVIVTGVKQSGGSIVATFTGSDTAQTATFGSDWTNLSQVNFTSDDGNLYHREFLDNISVSR